MAILSKFMLYNLADNINVVNMKKFIKREDAQITVFLSHKHTDREELKRVMNIFQSLGVSVYVDWLDDSMPKHTSSVTAEKIKGKINENDKFVLVATDAAIASKWCNWELGFGDAKKFDNMNLALFPIRENGKDWSGSEYMGLYPIIEYENGKTPYIFKEKFNDTDYFCYIPYFDGCDKQILGSIPMGYYITIKLSMMGDGYQDMPEGIEVKFNLRDWLRIKKM